MKKINNSKTPLQLHVLYVTLGIFVVLIWSTCYVTIKLLSGQDEPLTFAAGRALLAGLVLLSISIAKSKILPPRDTWLWLILSGFTGTSLALWGMFGSVSSEGAIIASILGNSQVILVAPLAVFFLKEKLNFIRWLSLGVGFIGLILVVVANNNGGGRLGGSLIALSASLGLAVSSLVSKRLSSRMPALTLTTWQFLIGAIPLVAAALFFENPFYIWPDNRSLLGLVYLAVISSAGGSIAWNWLLKRVDVIPLTALTMLGPPISLLMGLLIFSEPVTPLQWTGIGIILLSLFFLQRIKN